VTQHHLRYGPRRLFVAYRQLHPPQPSPWWVMLSCGCERTYYVSPKKPLPAYGFCALCPDDKNVRQMELPLGGAPFSLNPQKAFKAFVEERWERFQAAHQGVKE